MLNCREVSERVSDFLDATLPWSVRLQMRLHLLMCRLCREYVRQMALVIGALRRLPRHEPAAERRAELLAMFRAERP
jgi:predicted anti-sigma-YlaC factor YlaD